MVAFIGLVISILAFVVSAGTAWMTLFRRGQISMTRPTVIYFGPDGSRYGMNPEHQKVFLRTLLYSTGKRGQIVENMFIRLQRGETRQNFNVWVYGDDNLRRGSGLFVPEEGVATNHHFLPPPDLGAFKFTAGHYTVEIFVTVAGATQAQHLFRVDLDVTQEEATAIDEGNLGHYFNWGRDSGRYQHKITPPPSSPQELLSALTKAAVSSPSS